MNQRSFCAFQPGMPEPGIQFDGLFRYAACAALPSFPGVDGAEGSAYRFFMLASLLYARIAVF
jgi:hypothetical protein